MKHSELPSLAYSLFKRFCKSSLFEELEGDLEESFLRNKEKHGLSKAKRMYTREVLKMIRPSVLGRPESGPGYQLALVGSYVTLSIRNLKRNKLFSFINLFSLSVAMSTGLLVIGMITDLLQFDEFHENKKELYRVNTTPIYQEIAYKTQATSPRYLGQEMALQIPGIEVVNLGRHFGGAAIINDKNFYLKGIYADHKFLRYFSFELKSGGASALANPFNVFITESLAEKVYPDEDPIGQSFEIPSLGTFHIAGIVEDPPFFSHIQFEVIASISTTQLLATQQRLDPRHDEWNNLERYYNYVYIPDEEHKEKVEHWLSTTGRSYFQEPTKMSATFALQPIHQIVPGPDISDAIGPKMLFLPIIILSFIATAILLSAIFNYTNLSMARALRRAKEVGIRKLNGATRRSTALQFTVESIILSLLALVFGLGLFTFLRIEFIDLIPRAEEMVRMELSPALIGWFVVFAICAGLIAGISPSIFFARLSSLDALRSGQKLKTLSRIGVRKILIVVQCTLSIFFIMAVIVTHKQYTYSINMDMGFNKSQILTVVLQGNDPEIIRHEFSTLPEVETVSFSSMVPGLGQRHNIQIVRPESLDSIWVHQMVIDENYLDNMNIGLVAGNNFDAENRTNETRILVNETFIRNMNLGSASEALGSEFELNGNTVVIEGVVRDFIYGNLEEEINSLILRKTNSYQYANVKLSSNNIVETLDKLEEKWVTIDPNNRFFAHFLDDAIEGYYIFLVDFMKIFGFIGFIAVSISSLGLLGMALYIMETKLKEIGIRKTFGASEANLIYNLSKGFISMVMIGIGIGSPVCYFIFDRLILSEHVYRPEITFLEFGKSALLLLGICLLAIVSQTWSAASKNPTVVLRNE